MQGIFQIKTGELNMNVKGEEKVTVLSVSIPKDIKKKEFRYKAVILFCGEEEILFFNEEEVFKYKISSNTEFGEGDWNDTLFQIESDRAYKKGLNIVLFKKNSKKDVFNKLVEKDFSRGAIETALDRLEESGYINDRKYAEKYTETAFFQKKKTLGQIKRELIQKCIESNILEDVISAFEAPHDDEEEKIKQFINNKYHKLIMDGEIEYNKLVSIKRALYNKGFDVDVINRTVNEMLRNKDEY